VLYFVIKRTNEAINQLIKVAFTSILRVRLLGVLLKVIFILTLLWPKKT
jgi:hypothetical protein